MCRLCEIIILLVFQFQVWFLCSSRPLFNGDTSFVWATCWRVAASDHDSRWLQLIELHCTAKWTIKANYTALSLLQDFLHHQAQLISKSFLERLQLPLLCQQIGISIKIPAGLSSLCRLLFFDFKKYFVALTLCIVSFQDMKGLLMVKEVTQLTLVCTTCWNHLWKEEVCLNTGYLWS